MKRLSVLALVSVVAVLGLALQTQAHGGLFRSQRGCGSYAPVADSCGAVTVADCTPAPVQYVTHTVTRYKQVMVEKVIDEIISKPVTSEVKFEYTVQVPVTTPEKRTKTIFVSVPKQVQYNYTVCVPVTVPEKRTQTFYTTVQKEVPYTYTVLVPKTIQKTVKQTTFQSVTETVTDTVTVCRSVPVSCVDACGNCYTSCQRVMVQEPVTRCIVKRIPIVTDVVINEVICEPHVRQGTKIVCELVPQVREIIVNVCHIENKTMVGTKTVFDLVPQVQEYVVNVCTFTTEKRVGTRLVCNYVQEKVQRKVSFCQLVPEQVTVQVPVSTSCYTPVSCDSCGHTGGLFRRGRCR